MKAVIIVLVLALACCENKHDHLETLYNKAKFIQDINKSNLGWTAGFNDKFLLGDLEFFKSHLGYVKNEQLKSELPVESLSSTMIDAVIPDSFDAREKWPECASIREIADQSSCGSCWAVSTTSAFSDRTCIATKGATQVRLSAKDLMSCCGMLTCGNGCNGGEPLGAAKYFVSHGIVTGGKYGDVNTCQAYPFEPCNHHVEGPYKDCKDLNFKTPKCEKECASTYDKEYNKDKYFGNKAYSVKNNVKDIQLEIITNGPVVAGFTVYPSFEFYKDGVYAHTKGENSLGGHAVRVIGWGVEEGKPYWLVANSWNEGWGNKGLFKIIRGTDECGFEDEISAALVVSPKLDFLS